MNSTSIPKPKNRLTREPFNYYDKDEFHYIDELPYMPNNGHRIQVPKLVYYKVLQNQFCVDENLVSLAMTI
jgi:hypothetical protein